VAQRPEAQARGQQGPSNSPAPAGGQGNFSVAGSAGQGYANGAHGSSPWVNLNGVGIKNTFAWNVRAAWEPTFYNVGLGVSGEYTQLRFRGSVGSWDGYFGHPVLTPGLPAEAKLDVDLIRVAVEAGLLNSAIEIHPKLEWLDYVDRFQVTNTFTGSSTSPRRLNISNWGVGLCGSIDFGRWMGYGYYPGAGMPVLKAAASIGQSKTMRYYSWEAWLKIFMTPGWAVFGYSWMPAPQVSGELGWVHYSFDQNRHEDSVLPPAVLAAPVGLRDSNVSYRLDIPMGRVTVTF